MSTDYDGCCCRRIVGTGAIVAVYVISYAYGLIFCQRQYTFGPDQDCGDDHQSICTNTYCTPLQSDAYGLWFSYVISFVSMGLWFFGWSRRVTYNLCYDTHPHS